MPLTPLQATGEFDPVGTLFTLVLGLAAAYGAYRLWLRYQASGGTLRILGAGILGLLAVLVATAFALNIAAALGIA